MKKKEKIKGTPIFLDGINPLQNLNETLLGEFELKEGSRPPKSGSSSQERIIPTSVGKYNPGTDELVMTEAGDIYGTRERKDSLHNCLTGSTLYYWDP
jgi:hypothetical protein